jgi:hypothetical protein
MFREKGNDSTPDPGQYEGPIITNYHKINCSGAGISINYTGRKPLWKAD